MPIIQKNVYEARVGHGQNEPARVFCSFGKRVVRWTSLLRENKSRRFCTNITVYTFVLSRTRRRGCQNRSYETRARVSDRGRGPYHVPEIAPEQRRIRIKKTSY